MKKLLMFIAAVALLASCSNRTSKIKGEFSNFENKTVYLVRLDVGSSQVVDSMKTSEKGEFKFKLKFDKDQMPTFYLVKVDGNNFITLFVEPGEKITVKGDALQLEPSYEVNGSKTSEDIRMLSHLLNKTIASIDSLDALRATGLDSADYKMGKTFVNCKREFIKYIITNPKSMASLFAIYSQLSEDVNIFGANDDVNYFKLLVDSLSTVYPKSPYIVSLENHYSSLAQNALLNDIFATKKVEAIGVPEIALPNEKGVVKKLSDLKGKVVLLDFWDPSDNDALDNNLGLKQIYDRYKAKGFEIYQVSVATKAPWVAAVQRQKLEWVCVSDFLGANSPAVTSFNVQSIPANFLINKNGDLVARNLFGQQLEAKINSALK